MTVSTNAIVTGESNISAQTNPLTWGLEIIDQETGLPLATGGSHHCQH